MLEDVPKEGSPLKITGSVMMAVASSKEEVMEKIKSDIYAEKDVWDMDKVSSSALEKEMRASWWKSMLILRIDSDLPFQVGY